MWGKQHTVAHFIFYLSLIASLSFKVNANDICPVPRPGTPHMSFTLISGKPGQLREHCQSDLAKAIEMGFTSVVFSPAFMVDEIEKTRSGKPEYSFYKVLKDKTMEAGEFEACLSHIWNSGLHIVYMPHLEFIGTLRKKPEQTGEHWRANIKLYDPKLSYHDIVIQPFLNFLYTQLVTYPKKEIDLILSAELEASVYHDSNLWKNYAKIIKTQLNSHLETYAGKVRLGYNPNWRPEPTILWGIDSPEKACRNYRSFINELDFFSPSIYPSWSDRTSHGILQKFDSIFSGLKEVEIKFQSDTESIYCDVRHPLNKLDFNVGEFGTGANFTRSFEESYPKADQEQQFVDNRYNLYANVFELIKSKKFNFSTTHKSYWNFWTRGIFDPFGIRDEPLTMTDQKIIELLKSYKNWQCNFNGIANFNKMPQNTLALQYVISGSPKKVSYEIIHLTSGEKIEANNLGTLSTGTYGKLFQLNNYGKGVYVLKLVIDDLQEIRKFTI